MVVNSFNIRLMHNTNIIIDSFCSFSIGKAYGDEVIRAIVNVNGQKKEFFGKGKNSTCAKRAAAKLALKSLGHSNFVI